MKKAIKLLFLPAFGLGGGLGLHFESFSHGLIWTSVSVGAVLALNLLFAALASDNPEHL